MNQATALYRFFDSRGALLYVGITNSPRNRFDQHRADKPWWPDVARYTIDWKESRDAALRAESDVIWLENPVYNLSRPFTEYERIWRETVAREPRIRLRGLPTCNVKRAAEISRRLGTLLGPGRDTSGRMGDMAALFDGLERVLEHIEDVWDAPYDHDEAWLTHPMVFAACRDALLREMPAFCPCGCDADVTLDGDIEDAMA